MRFVACLIALTVATGAPAAPPRRILSLNLCADQLLVALADPGQIVGLTRLSRDPALSAVAPAARNLPVSAGTAEDVLVRRPDLVLAAPGWSHGTLPRTGEGYALLELPPADSYVAVRRQIGLVARTVGHPERGVALIRRMDRALAAIPRDAGRGRTAALYQRRGYLTGQGTLVDELMTRVGLVNLARRLGRPALSRLSLEEMVAARPDLLLDETPGTVRDQGTEMLRHPALAPIPRLVLPEAWTTCGGPAYVAAAASLARQLRSLP